MEKDGEHQRRPSRRSRHRYPEFFFFNDTATTEIYTLSLHDALPIFVTSGVVAFSVSATHSAALPFRSASYTSSENHDSWRNSQAQRRSGGNCVRRSPSRGRSFLKLGGNWNRTGPSLAPSLRAISRK